MRPTDLQLDIDSFAGPFDLLCTILLRRELALADVQVAEIIVGYIQRLAFEERVDADAASEFLVLIAALLEIKSREMLASDAALEIDMPAVPEAQAEILERLIRYSTFRNAAAWLGKLGSRERYWRVASRPVIRRRETFTGPTLDPTLLRRSMQVLLAQPDVDVRHLVGKHATVHEMTSRLLEIIRDRRTFMFEDAVADCSRLDQAVAFVAALELAKNGFVELMQPDLFGPIEVVERAEEAGAAGHDQELATVAADASEEFQIA